MKQRIAWCLLAACSAAGLTGCASNGIDDAGDGNARTTSEPPDFAATDFDGTFSDAAAGCSFSLPSDGYRLEVTHFSTELSADKVRNQIRITPEQGKSLARIDIFENASGQGPEAWAKEHLAYLLDDTAVLRSEAVGEKRLVGLLIERPRSPQAFASKTVVVADGDRVAVISGSDVSDGERNEAFERLVSDFSLEEAS